MPALSWSWEGWLAGLDDELRGHAAELRALYASRGWEDPESAARAEVGEKVAQAAPDVAIRDWRDETEIWEHQGRPLTAGALGLGLDDFAELPVRVAVYDGTGKTVFYDPVEIGYTGVGEMPEAVIITVIAQTSDE